MLNSTRKAVGAYITYLPKLSRVKKYYKSLRVYNFIINEEIYIHSGNSLVIRTHNYFFKSRNIKFNVFFKKPLVRPVKRKKAR